MKTQKVRLQKKKKKKKKKKQKKKKKNLKKKKGEELVKSPFEQDHRKVFVGGIPPNTTVEELTKELAMLGIHVVECNGITYRSYGWSYLTLATSEQAERLMQMSPIKIRGRNIDIRPFIDRGNAEQHLQNKPKDHEMLETIIQIVQASGRSLGLDMAQLQARLYMRLNYRPDGMSIENVKFLCVCLCTLFFFSFYFFWFVVCLICKVRIQL